MSLARALMHKAATDGFGARPRAVYKRTGLPCLHCATIILQRGQGDNSRSTFWCPTCQT